MCLSIFRDTHTAVLHSTYIYIVSRPVRVALETVFWNVQRRKKIEPKSTDTREQREETSRPTNIRKMRGKRNEQKLSISRSICYHQLRVLFF